MAAGDAERPSSRPSSTRARDSQEPAGASFARGLRERARGRVVRGGHRESAGRAHASGSSPRTRPWPSGARRPRVFEAEERRQDQALGGQQAAPAAPASAHEATSDASSARAASGRHACGLAAVDELAQPRRRPRPTVAAGCAQRGREPQRALARAPGTDASSATNDGRAPRGRRLSRACRARMRSSFGESRAPPVRAARAAKPQASAECLRDGRELWHVREAKTARRLGRVALGERGTARPDRRHASVGSARCERPDRDASPASSSSPRRPAASAARSMRVRARGARWRQS